MAIKSKSFNVLDRQLNVHQSHLLEASAGTGKTYSIENLVVRLLVEPDSQHHLPAATIAQILVVTFTRAATGELKERIRNNLSHSLNWLKAWLIDSSEMDGMPDFLLAICEQGEHEAIDAKRALEQALFCFDQAQIFTIHGFCSRMLRESGFECDLGFNVPSDDEVLSPLKILGVVRDFFRTEVRSEAYSHEQLKIVLKKHKGQIEHLENALCKVIKGGAEVARTPNFSTLLEEFNKIMQTFKQMGYCSSQLILEDFILQAPSYKGNCNRQGELLPDRLSCVHRFACFFQQETWSAADFDLMIADGLVILEALDPAELKAKTQPTSAEKLHYPELIQLISERLQPLVLRARDPLAIFACMAFDCQKLFKRFSGEEETPVPDDLLHAMSRGINNRQFLNRVRDKYRAAIVDEFQDTDPVQWEIFRRLFIEEPTHSCALYLVGDPKQSIYAFRQADIYTYLAASQSIQKQNHASLDTNFRSQASLVGALNCLFCKENTPGLISLPRIQQCLEYREVNASSKNVEKIFSDDWGSIHFCLASAELGRAKSWPSQDLEKETFFPFIVEEIQRLNRLDGVKFGQCAILVRDRYQAERVSLFLKKWKIPVIAQHRASLADSPAYSGMQECLRAVLRPYDHSGVKIALGGKLIGWTDEQVRASTENDQLDFYFAQWHGLRKTLFKKGFIAFFQELLQSHWHSDRKMTMIEYLLAQEEGIELYRDLQQIADQLAEFQTNTHASPEGLLSFLDDFPSLKEDQDERLKIQDDPNQEAVQILTLHLSKGLEFDVVFALGLINRTAARDELIPLQENGVLRLIAPNDFQQSAVKAYHDENDAEKMRQLYVAMTRAKYRLYLPVAVVSDHQPVTLGCASPMELFLARLNQPETGADQLYERIQWNDGLFLKGFIERIKADEKITCCDLNQRSFSLEETQKPCTEELVCPKLIGKVPGFASYIHSFSSLSPTAKEEVQIVLRGTKVFETPHDYLAEIKNPYTLPSGSETGILLHQIFESINFEVFKDMVNPSDCLSIVRPFLERHPLKEWELALSEIVFNAMKTPLKEGVRLCDIQTQNSYREMEFLYPYQGCSFELPEEIQLSNHFLKGFIDLVFVDQDRYYLVDWKSNWVGFSSQDYSKEHLSEAMQSNSYHLQMAIYKEALRRYLKVVDRRPFEECFGGVFYVFLRGLDPTQNSGNGIYEC